MNMETASSSIPFRPEMIEADWLTKRLREAGALGTAKVSKIDATSVGAGMLGENVRYVLEYTGGEAGPASLVAKFPSGDPGSRRFATDMGLYLAEVRFYQDFGGTLPIRVPHCYHADIEERSGEFVLLMEDLAPARGGNQLAGCGLEDAAAVIRQAAALHAPHFNDPTLKDLSYLKDRPRVLSSIASIMPQALAQFHERYDNILEPELMAICDRFVERCLDYYALVPETYSLAHYDLRLDNILFDVKGEKNSVAVVDWQSVSIGMPALDLAFFLGSSLPAAVRREHERPLLETYLEELKKYGVNTYEYDELWLQYRVSTLIGVSTPMHAAYGTKQTERGDAMYLAMARGACQQAIDVDAIGALDAFV